MREMFVDLWDHRELLQQLARRDLRIRYKQAVIGVAWAILMPLVVVLSGWILRIAFARMGGGSVPPAELAGIAVKSVAWAFFIGALGFSTASITGNLPLVTRVYFPRAVLPLAAVVTQLADVAIAIVALAVILPFLGIGLHPGLLWAIPLGLLLVMHTTAAALLFSCANVFYRDARHLVQLVLSFGIFFTPVFFDASAFGAGRTWLVMLNPLAPVLEGLRLTIVAQHDLLLPLAGAAGAVAWTPAYLGYSAAVGLVGLVASAAIFHHAQFRFAEYV